MNLFEKILYFLQGEMDTPKPFGWFHLLWIGLIVISITFIYIKRKNYNERKLKIALGIYGIVALILEILKQLIWTFNYDPITNIVTWDYEWYSFPYQLCTTPIYVCLICLFLKDNKLRKSLLSYLSFFTVLGGISTILLPDSCFVSDILVNIHTMWLHCGSFVVSIYLLINKEVELKEQNMGKAIIVFLSFVLSALLLNIIIYKCGILNGETFNMFYISPYFISSLPVFNIIQQNVPYILYLLIYMWALIIGAYIIFYISIIIKKLCNKLRS